MIGRTFFSKVSIWLIGIWLFTGYVSNSWALTIDAQQQLEYADHLYSGQQYRRAAEEYQRFTFFFTDHPLRREVQHKAGRAFLLSGDAQSALATFKELSIHLPPDKTAIESSFMMVECYLRLKSPTQAIVQLHNIITVTDDNAIKDRAYHRLGWLYIEAADWSNALRALGHVSQENRIHYRTTEIQGLISGADKIPRKRPALAGTLSIIPGAGQLYCERYEDALIAFIVNVGLFWAANESFQEDQPALGGLLTFVGLGFYTGNIYGAISGAHKYNQNKQREYVDKLRHYQVRHSAARPEPSDKVLLFSLRIPF